MLSAIAIVVRLPSHLIEGIGLAFRQRKSLEESLADVNTGTCMGAPLAIEDSIPGVVSTLLGLQGKFGLQYLDYVGRTVPW